MSEKIDRFEIVSQFAQSPSATVYKALDCESQQTVALKVVRLDQVKDRVALLKKIFEEAEQAKPLSSHNIAALYGVGDEGDQLLGAAEYVQGNSVATTLARKDGFSIWDLQDIARQVCQALDHARMLIGDILTVTVQGRHAEVCCPLCQVPAVHVHGRYHRHPEDFPCSGRRCGCGRCLCGSGMTPLLRRRGPG